MTISDFLSQRRFNCGSEAELQACIGKVLEEYAPRCVFREVDLGEFGRVDFMVGTTAIEIKTKGSLVAVRRQLFRYAMSERVSNLILATTVRKLCRMPASMNDKALGVVLLKTWGSV